MNSSPRPPGVFRLFQFAGIVVYLHWTWFVAIAVLVQLQSAKTGLAGLVVLAQFVALFGIVLLHEFGHALACRQVGGQANMIVLWPLGGIAFVRPPMRPGPVLWSIAAGPLVNVVLAFPLLALWYYTHERVAPPVEEIIVVAALINVMLFAFNMLPIYPLDGGQILQAILWFFIGRQKALKITAGIGIVAAAAGMVYAIYIAEFWLLLVMIFIGWQAINGWRYAHRADFPSPT